MKRFQRIGLSVTVALGMLAMVPGAVFAAQPACGDTLMANTTLTADLDCSGYNGTALYMGKKGITLNLNGHIIWGFTGDDGNSGVDTNYKKHTTIKNGTIANFDTAVYLDQSVGGTVKNLDITGDDGGSGDTGIYIYYGANNTVNNVDINTANYGFYLYGSGGNWLTNNRVTGSTYGLYGEYENGDHIVGNYMEYDYVGFYEDYSGNQVYDGNTANGDPDGGSYGWYLDCDDYGWVHLLNNVATGNSSYGFELYYCYDANDAAVGHSIIDGNKANDNSVGFYDEESLYAVWTNNTANGNDSEGFYLYDSGHAVFQGNVANHNGADGVYIYDNYSPYYSPAVVKNNKANYNSAYGFDADYGIPNATGNVARHNGNAPDNCYNMDCNN